MLWLRTVLDWWVHSYIVNFQLGLNFMQHLSNKCTSLMCQWNISVAGLSPASPWLSPVILATQEKEMRSHSSRPAWAKWKWDLISKMTFAVTDHSFQSCCLAMYFIFYWYDMFLFLFLCNCVSIRNVFFYHYIRYYIKYLMVIMCKI
jgi:hypothetical protein